MYLIRFVGHSLGHSVPSGSLALHADAASPAAAAQTKGARVATPAPVGTLVNVAIFSFLEAV